MPELPTDRNEEESLHPMVWAIVATHQRQRPELYSGMHLEKRIQELAIVIGEMIACAGHGIQRPESETDEYVGRLLRDRDRPGIAGSLSAPTSTETGVVLPHRGGRKPS